MSENMESKQSESQEGIAPRCEPLKSCPECGKFHNEHQEYSSGPCAGKLGEMPWHCVVCNHCGYTAQSSRTKNGAGLNWNRSVHTDERRTHTEVSVGWISVSDKLPTENKPVIIAGGLAIWDGASWYSGMEEPLYRREITWKVYFWAYIPTSPQTVQIDKSCPPAEATSSTPPSDSSEIQRLNSIIKDCVLTVEHQNEEMNDMRNEIVWQNSIIKEFRKALEAITRRVPIMTSTGDYREGQLHALEACSHVARAALAACTPQEGKDL